MVRVGSVARSEVHGELGVGRHRAEELLREVGLESRDGGQRQLGSKQAKRAARDVDRADPEGLVHRHRRRPVAPDARAVTERAVERLPQRDADVLDGVVRAGLEIALRLDTQPEPGVAPERLDHVI